MSKFAVIETGGKQYAVGDDAVIDVEKLHDHKAGDTVVFDKVLLLDDGSKTDVGMPYLDGKTVTGTVEMVGKRKKISVVRFRSKTGYRRRYGHRQPFCRVRVVSIS